MSRKIKTLLLSLTPIAVYFIIEILVSCGCTFTGMIGMTAVSGTVFGNWLSGFLEQEGLYLISILAYLIFFVIGVFWYKQMRAGGKYPVWDQQKNLNLPALLKLAVLGIFVQFSISFLLNLVYIVRPDVMQNYTKVMENLGSGNPSLFSVFYVVITAPIVEEMLMRGLCLVILRKEFPILGGKYHSGILFWYDSSESGTGNLCVFIGDGTWCCSKTLWNFESIDVFTFCN